MIRHVLCVLVLVAGVASLPASAVDRVSGRGSVALVPGGQGLVIHGGAQREAVALPFSASRDDVARTARKLWGSAIDSGVMAECGAGPLAFLAFENGTRLHFQDDAFVGWAIGPNGDASPATPTGIAIGMTRSALERAAPDVEIFESTLGTEFATPGGVFGILSAPGPDALAEHLWAGTSCNFR